MIIILSGTGKRGVAVEARAEVGAKAEVGLERSPVRGGDPETERVKRARRVGVAGGVAPGTGVIQIEEAGTVVVDGGAGVVEESEAGPAPSIGDLPSK